MSTQADIRESRSKPSDYCLLPRNLRRQTVAVYPFQPTRFSKERGLSFELVRDFEWSGAYVLEDVRRDYGEPRFQALGEIDGRLHMLVFTPRGGDVHVISLRKANRREIKRYEEEKEIPGE